MSSAYLKVGQEIAAFYYPATNFATEIQFLILPIAVPAVGSIAQITNQSVMLSTAPAPLYLTLRPGVIVIKPDGSPGFASDLVAGLNVKAYYYPQTKMIVLVEIQ